MTSHRLARVRLEIMNRKQIGQHLRQRRLARGLTLRELNDRSGVHYSSIGQIENGEFNATLDTLFALAEGMETTLQLGLGDSFEAAALGHVPEARREIARRFLRVLADVPGEDLDAFLATLALWELKYAAS